MTMKTPGSEDPQTNPITITITMEEALTLYQALLNLDRTHRNRRPPSDCSPPRIRELVILLRAALETQQPKIVKDILSPAPAPPKP